MKTWQKYTIALATLGALAAIAYWEEETTKSESAAEQSSKRIFLVEPSDIDKIEFKINNNLFRLSKNEAKWNLEEPVQYPADQEIMAQLTKQLTEAKFSKSLTVDASRLSEFGLDGNAVTRFWSKDKEYGFKIGKDSPVGMNVYLQVVGQDQVYLVSKALQLALSKDLLTLRFKGLTEDNFDELREFSYELTNTESIHMNKVEDSVAWTMTSPASYEVDQEEFRDYWSWLRTIRVKNVIDVPSEKDVAAFQKEQTPYLTLSWKTKTNLVSSVVFQFNEEDILARFKGAERIFVLDSAIKTSLQKTVMDFRNRHIVKLDFSKVDRVTIDQKHYEKKEFDWLETAAGKTAPQITRWLVELEYAKAEAFLEMPPADLEKLGDPHHTWILSTSSKELGEVTLQLWWEDDKKESLLVRSSMSPIIFKMNPRVLRELDDHPIVETEHSDG